MEMSHLLYVKVGRDHPKETFLIACCGVSEVGGSSPGSLEVPLNESWHWGLTRLQVGEMEWLLCLPSSRGFHSVVLSQDQRAVRNPCKTGNGSTREGGKACSWLMKYSDWEEQISVEKREVCGNPKCPHVPLEALWSERGGGRSVPEYLRAETGADKTYSKPVFITYRDPWILMASVSGCFS